MSRIEAARVIMTLDGPPAALIEALRAGTEVPIVLVGRIVAEHSSWERGEQEFFVAVDSTSLPAGIPGAEDHDNG